jgi:hypothetical protein
MHIFKPAVLHQIRAAADTTVLSGSRLCKNVQPPV